MPVVVQICIVVVTLALVAIAIATIRAMIRFDRAANEVSAISEDVRASVTQFREVTREVREMVSSLSEIVPPLQRTAARFEDLGQRTAQLSATVLEEVERPVSMAVALVRGVRIGTTTFFGRLSERLAHRRSATNGGIDNA